MKKNALLIYLFFSFSVLFAQQTPKWTFEMYDKYTYKTFTDFEATKQIINHNQIDTALINAAIFYATNRQRAKYGRKPLKPLKELFLSAQEHSTDMIKYDFFLHLSTLKGKESPSIRIDRYFPKKFFFVSAENIALNHITKKMTYINLAVKVVNQWMRSRGHRANILHKKMVFFGCGVGFQKYSSSSKSWEFRATQNFLYFIRR